MSQETSNLIAKLKRLIPDSTKAKEYFLDLENIKPIVVSRALDSERVNEFESAKLKRARLKKIEAIIKVLDKIEIVESDEYRVMNFTPPELETMESVIKITRPALFVVDGKYLPALPPIGGDLDWNAILDPHRDDIQKTCKSVGRIEFRDSNGKEWEQYATGFLVADDVIMTNQHVAKYFCDKNVDANKWVFDPETNNRRIDYSEEKNTTKSREFEITEILKIYESIDLALFRVAKTSKPEGQKLPTPLVIANRTESMLKRERPVYVVGYPTRDTNELERMLYVFDNTYKVKRLQPGIITGIQQERGVLYHDCSTLAGNSGSCVIDIELNQVIGLHFSGILSSEFNEALAFPLLSATDKSDLEEYGVKFAE